MGIKNFQAALQMPLSYTSDGELSEAKYRLAKLQHCNPRKELIKDKEFKGK